MIVVIVLYAIVFLIVPYVLYQVTLGLMGSFVAASLSAILGVVVTIFCIERLDRKVRRIRRGGTGNNGRITSSVDGYLSNETVNYTYDALNRLTAAAATNGWLFR